MLRRDAPGCAAGRARWVPGGARFLSSAGSPRGPQVVFVGEAGQDHGGVSQELFTIAARAFSDPQSGAFRHYPSRLLWFPAQVRRRSSPAAREVGFRKDKVMISSAFIFN